MANFGSISMARFKSEMASVACAPLRCCAFIAALKDFQASRKGVVASGRQTGLLFDTWQRFAGPGPELVYHLAQCFEDVVLLGRRRLLFRQSISGLAIPGAQA